MFSLNVLSLSKVKCKNTKTFSDTNKYDCFSPKFVFSNLPFNNHLNGVFRVVRLKVKVPLGSQGRLPEQEWSMSNGKFSREFINANKNFNL